MAITLHWAMAALVIGQFCWGWWMVGLPESPPGLQADAFNLHKSFGLVILGLLVLRLAWRLAHAPPASTEPDGWRRTAATWTHRLLYATLAWMTLSGYLGSSFTKYPIRFFGAVLPRWTEPWPDGKALMSDLHLVGAWALGVLVALHIAAACWHGWRRDGTVARLGLRWPATKEHT